MPKKKKKSRMCAFGKRRYEEWNYIFVKGKESNFALTWGQLFKEEKYRPKSECKKESCRRSVEKGFG